jgi:hypothetical protein
MAALRSFQSDMEQGLLDPGGITRKKAEQWHYLEILTHTIEPDCFVYLVMGRVCKHFQTVDEAMTFIEQFWNGEKKEHRRMAEYYEEPSYACGDAEVNPIDEWEVIH